ncbi:MAG TPA: type II secretion system major pseudopilin GspG [Gammaproteobacteria bacterium]|nr:type II secretion system major pseudopilin GspG [Gammaproteobacteria bacterium]
MSYLSRRRRAFPPERGFTLIEVMIVVVILAILAAIIVPRVMSAPEKARVTRAKTDIQAVVSALSMYKLDNYTYPTTEQGLAALVTKPASPPVPPNWHQYLSKIPKDPWGQPYKYLFPGTHGEPFDVWTDGPPSNNPGVTDPSAQIGNWNIDEDSSGSGDDNSGG